MNKRQVKLEKTPLDLAGDPVELGSKAPNFNVLDNDLKAFSISDIHDKILVISSVPSLDTPVCDAQTRRFNQAAIELGEDVEILTISMDLPFAQKRWCAATGVDRVRTLSDHKSASFGKAFGVLIPDLRLLARAVFVLDRDKTIRYIQIVDEITNEPDYTDVLNAVKALIT
ncbi:MAG: thiol peroxidase [Deltaproteobacteria bacterium]|nr:thiol peroxidase [Deltaproteobacteria bacterium]